LIDLGSIAVLHERKHTLAAYCSRCNRWAVLPRRAYSSPRPGSPDRTQRDKPEATERYEPTGAARSQNHEPRRRHIIE